MVKLDCGQDVDVVGISSISSSLEDVLSSMTKPKLTLSSWFEWVKYWGLSQENYKPEESEVGLLYQEEVEKWY